MPAHFKCTSRLQTLQAIELLTVHLFGIFLRQMMQKSSSPDADDGDDFSLVADFCVFVRLAGGVAFLFSFAAFLSSTANFLATAAAFFSFKIAKFSGDVSSVLFIAFRPRFDGGFAGVPCIGPISASTDDTLEQRDMEVDGRDTEASDETSS